MCFRMRIVYPAVVSEFVQRLEGSAMHSNDDIP
jgi:hypothetical protein